MSEVAHEVGVGDPVDRSLSRGMALAGLLVVMGGLFFDILWRQLRWAVREPADWGHTLVIPAIALYLVYLNRDKLVARPLKTTWSALIPMIIGVGWYMFCSAGPPAVNNFNLQGAGLFLTVFGVVLLLFGWRAMRFLWFPLLYLAVFGLTISPGLMNRITYELQNIAARGSYVLLRLLNVDADISGNTLTIWDNGVANPLNIAEACSGMRMVVAFLALGVLLAYTRLNHTWQRAVLVLLAVPTAIFVNMLRVVTLGLLTFIDTDLAAGDFHELVGLVWLVPALLIYLGLIWLIRRLVIDEDGAEAAFSTATLRETFHKLEFDRLARRGVIVACITLAVAALGFRSSLVVLNIYLQKKPVELRRQLSKIPRTLGRWQAIAPDELLDESTIEALGTDRYLNRQYAVDGDPRNGFVSLHVAYYTDTIDAVPHVPERCLYAAGLDQVGRTETIPLAPDRSAWTMDEGPDHRGAGRPFFMTTVRDRITGTDLIVRMPVGDLQMRVLEFQPPQDPDMRLIAGYFFVANGRSTPSPEFVRLWAFNKTSEYAYYAKVEFATVGREVDKDSFTDQVNSLMDELMPHLMRSLPDWADVEAGRYPENDQDEPTLGSQQR